MPTPKLYVIVDALPWGWDITEPGLQGLVRVVAIVATASLLVFRARASPAEDIYQTGYDIGYEAGRRAAAKQLRAGMRDGLETRMEAPHTLSPSR